MDPTRATGDLALGKTLADEAAIAEVPARPLATGSARFARGRELGRGGMGRVFEAVDQQFNRIVAVKEIVGDATGAAARRFTTEAIVTGNLEHPGIPSVYERGVDDQVGRSTRCAACRAAR